MLQLRDIWRSMRLAAVALALVGAAALLGPFSSSALARGPRAEPCNHYSSHALKRTRDVLVWDKRTGNDPYSGGRLFTLYACLRPSGTSIAIGQNASDGAEYIGNEVTSHLTVSGKQVSDLVTRGLASQQACFKYTGPSNPQCVTAATRTAQVFNLAARRSLRQPLAAGAVAYAFAPRGAIAWEAPVSPEAPGGQLMLEAVGFYPSSLKRGSIETLDTGDLGSSLQFAGLTLRWTNAGQAKSVAVSNAG
jgi:hypothetical protein